MFPLRRLRTLTLPLLFVFAATQVFAQSEKASMVSPTPGSTLGGASVSFTWSAGSGASAYYLQVGTSPGKEDIFGKNVGLATSQTVSSLPTDGSTVYVRLNTLFNGLSQFNDYGYNASGGASLEAPTVDVRFSSSIVPVNQSIPMFFTVNNPNASASLSNINFVDTLPAGMAVVRPNGLVGQCGPGGTINAPGGGTTIGLSGLTLPANSSCEFAINVAGTTAGDKANTVVISSPDSGSSTTTTVLTVMAKPGSAPPPPAGGGTVPSNSGGDSSQGAVQSISGGAGSSAGSSASPCECGDVASLQHRLEEVTSLKAGLEARVQVTPAAAPGTRDAWLAMQNEVRGALTQLWYVHPPTPGNIAMFNNYVDPVCGRQTGSGGACLDLATAAHQQMHDASCRAGRWNFQPGWTLRAMIQEEINANQAEMDHVQAEIGRLSCTCSSFAVVVQVVTVSSISMPGMSEGSARSLNGQQGIVVPITLHDDGTFEGSGSGTDSGAAAAYAAGGYAKSQFGHAQSVQASGVITPGNCSTQPCSPDIMHLVLAGMGAPQAVEGQARFPGHSGDINQVTPGGAGAMQFDIPAYVGQGAQKTLLDMGPVNSTATVTIVAGNAVDSNAAGADQGASLLYSIQQCRRPTGAPSPTILAGSAPGQSLSASGGGSVSGAVGAGGGGGPGNSNPPQNTSPYPPATPDWIKIQMTPSASGAGIVQVSWSAVDTAQSYNVYRNLSYVDSVPNEKVVGTVPAGTTSFTDTTAPLFIAALYSVTALNAEGESDRRNAQVTRPVATSDAQVWGFADTHTHPFVDRAFGGDLFWGRPFGPMNVALGDCGNAHPTQNIDAGAVVAGIVLGGFLGPLAATVPVAGPALGVGLGPLLGPILGKEATDAMVIIHPGTKGAPTFDSWPRFDTKVHQMMFESWLYRAYVGGLRLIVAHAVNNETICLGLKGLGHVASGRTCDDMEAVGLQLQDARDMESYINTECARGDPVLGCVSPGVGWFHVVTSSTEARQTINRGQLAVVLGIEVDHPFGCGRGRTCSKTDVDNAVQAAFAAGVRHMFPIHLSDNPFGGMALYDDLFAASSQLLNNTPVDAIQCPVDADDGPYTFQLTNYSQKPTCNAQGLTDLGNYLVQDLAYHHMIIDIDHMSRKSVEDSFALLAQFHYPVIAGHNTLVVLHQGGGRTEAARTTGQVATIKSLGGLVSIGTGDVGTVKDVATAAESSLPHTCSNSTNTWFQSYSRAVSLMGGWSTAAVSLSTDQGLTDMVGPRFKGTMGVACAGGDASEATAQRESTWVHYPFFTLTPGTPLGLKKSSLPSGRSFDFNTEGMAHFGLFPDLVQDLRSQGVTDAQLGPLFRSVEGYLQMWQRAEQATVTIPVEHAATAVQGAVALQLQSGSGATTSWVIVKANDDRTGVVLNGTVAISGGNGQVTGTTGVKITFPTCYEVSGVGSQKQRSAAPCSGKVEVPGYSQVTFTAP
jgi:microsomal dipeptidase-like Zn-dependent dipeptidase